MQAAERITKCLDILRGRMMELAVHPTRPRAQQPARGGGRPRSHRPIHDAELVADFPPMPTPSVVPIGPDPDPQPPL